MIRDLGLNHFQSERVCILDQLAQRRVIAETTNGGVTARRIGGPIDASTRIEREYVIIFPPAETRALRVHAFQEPVGGDFAPGAFRLCLRKYRPTHGGKLKTHADIV